MRHDEQLDSSWSLDKKIPLTLLVALVSQFLAGMWFLAEVKKDVEFLKVQVVEQHLRDDMQDRSGADARSLLRAQLDRIEGNQYRMLENQAQEVRHKK